MFRLPPRLIQFPLLMVLALALIIGVIVVVFFVSHEYSDGEGTAAFTYAHAQLITIDERTAVQFEQSFAATKPDIGVVQFSVINEHVTHYVDVSLRREGAITPVVKYVMIVSPQQGAQTLTLEIPRGSTPHDGEYVLSISLADARSMAWLAFPGDWYPEGQLSINGQTYQHNLAFSFQYHNQHLVQVLAQRLPMFKPGWWHHTASFVVMYLVFISLVLWYVFSLSKKQ